MWACIDKRRRICGQKTDSDGGAGETNERKTEAEGLDNTRNDLSERELSEKEAQDRVNWRLVYSVHNSINWSFSNWRVPSLVIFISWVGGCDEGTVPHLPPRVAHRTYPAGARARHVLMLHKRDPWDDYRNYRAICLLYHS